MTPQVTADATGRRLRELASMLRRRGVGRLVARTAGYNVASTAAAGLGGIIVARALGPEMRGEYAAVTAWFGVALMIGGMGQPAALCFHVAHDPGNARGYVATSRAMMLVTGIAALAGGILLAPLLARGNAGADRRLPDRLRHLDRGLRRGQLHVLAAGDEPALVEHGAGEPAGPEPGFPRRVVAAADAHADCRADRPGPHHAPPARLGLLPLPVCRSGARPRSGQARPAPCSVRRGPDRGPDPGCPQRQPRPARPLPGRASGGPRPVRDRGLVHAAPDPAGVGDRERRLSAAGVETTRGRLGVPDAVAGHPGHCLRRGGCASAA